MARWRPIPHIAVTPDHAYIGEPVKISLRGFSKNQPVTVRVCATNLFGQTWESRAEFLTDWRGRIDVASKIPLSGTYRQADSAGLFWSMSPIAGKISSSDLPSETLVPADFHITASTGDKPEASAWFRRFFIPQGVKRISVREANVRGTFFVPSDNRPHPGVIVLGGSEGGLHERNAAFLASKGYATLALAYFSFEDLPPSLNHIPLEYFEAAIQWLQSRKEIRRREIAVIGTSRGGELALLLGATFRQIQAAVALAPSGVVWAGGYDDSGVDQPAWTYGGQPLLFLSNRDFTPEQKEKAERIVRTSPIDQAPLFLMSLENKKAVEKASIAVEKINGPVLLISGRDDRIWPSTLMADMVVARLKQAKHGYPDRHLAYEGAGHFIPLPGLPATVHTMSMAQTEIALGGDTEHTAAAADDAWAHIVKFLNAAFRQQSGK